MSLRSPASINLQLSSQDPELRRIAFQASHTLSPANLTVLEQLVSARQELAALLGHRSFADMKLVSRMAKSPEQVVQFLLSLHDRLNAKVDQETRVLLATRDRVTRRTHSATSVTSTLSSVTTVSGPPTASISSVHSSATFSSSAPHAPLAAHDIPFLKEHAKHSPLASPSQSDSPALPHVPPSTLKQCLQVHPHG